MAEDIDRDVIRTALVDPEAVTLMAAVSEAVIRRAPKATVARPLRTLADRIAAALVEARDARRVGPMLTAAELEEIRRRYATPDGHGYVNRLLAHTHAQAAVMANQNAEMDRLKGRVEELLGELRGLAADVRRALYMTPLREVIGPGVMADQVPFIEAVLKANEESTTR